jgi:hypothetical protein
LYYIKDNQTQKKVLENDLGKTIKQEYNPEQVNILLSINFTFVKKFREFIKLKASL